MSGGEFGIQLNQCFCEDVRMEEGNKPMLLGLLASSVYAFKDEEFPLPSVITWVRAPGRIREVDLSLTITNTISGKSNVQTFSRQVQCNDDENSEEWSSMLVLKLDGTMTVGDKIEALVETGDHRARAILMIKLNEAEEIQS